MAQMDDCIDVIFLDIDGVLLPFGGQDDINGSTSFPARTLEALSLLLQTVPTAVLVLSSTWRVRSDFCDDILRQLREYGRQHGNGSFQLSTGFFDTTSVINHSERQWELYEWLSNCAKEVRSWVALDDEELLLGDSNARYRAYFEGHVIKTDSAVGLTRQDAQKAIELLRSQIKASDRIILQ